MQLKKTCSMGSKGNDEFPLKIDVLRCLFPSVKHKIK
jgi:hypothetical protein